MLKKHGPTFFKYVVVGVSGTMIDVGLFGLLLTYTALSSSVAATISFLFAVINNYTWNHLWTYAKKTKSDAKQFGKFFLVSCGGLILNILFLHLFSSLLGLFLFPLPVWGSIIAKVGASGAVLLYNFLLNTFWTFASAK